MNRENVNDFYDGSRFFSFLTTVSGLPIDQVNFLVCQFFILVVAYFFRTQFNVERVGPRVRHVIEVMIGFFLLYFCFGRGLVHVVLQSLICWVVMKVFKYGPMEKIVLGTAVGYLCVTHIYRMIYDYGGFTLDITGPLMLSTQRLSSLAFGLADAEKLKKDVKMVDNLKSKVVHKFPSVLEFLSFMFTFHGVMCGPVCFYSDYIKFIEGTNYDSKAQQQKQQNRNVTITSTAYKSDENYHKDKIGVVKNGFKMFGGSEENNHNLPNHLPSRPSPMPVIRRKLLLAGLFGASTIILLPLVPISLVKSPEYATYNFFYKVFLIILFTALQRQKYYFAWKLGEASNLNAGLGYNGVDEHGNSRWDLIANVDVLKVEFSTSLKILIDNWNISTACWLRYIIYDRLHSIVPVFLFSALWHGFYPGYYITFITGGLFISTARLMRKVVRPHFQTSPALKFVYDVVTFVASRLAVSYLGLPFLVLEFWSSFYIIREVYFFMHIVAGSIALTLLSIKYQQSKASKNKLTVKKIDNISNNISNNINNMSNSINNVSNSMNNVFNNLSSNGKAASVGIPNDDCTSLYASENNAAYRSDVNRNIAFDHMKTS